MRNNTDRQPIYGVDGQGNAVPNLAHSPETVPELIGQWRELGRRWRMHAATCEQDYKRETFIDKAEEMERLAAEVERVYRIEHA